MTYFEQVRKGKTKLRRSTWPAQDYISLIETESRSEKPGVQYWDNSKFKWVRVKLDVHEFTAKDWQEAD